MTDFPSELEGRTPVSLSLFPNKTVAPAPDTNLLTCLTVILPLAPCL